MSDPLPESEVLESWGIDASAGAPVSAAPLSTPAPESAGTPLSLGVASGRTGDEFPASIAPQKQKPNSLVG